MTDLRKVLLYFCALNCVVITVPMLLLDKFWYSQPYESAVVLKNNLQSSGLLEKAHILSLGSVIPLTIDLILDLSSQTAEIAAVAQIKERVVILLTLAAFSLSFLFCKDLGALPAVYVAVNSIRANIVTTTMYYAVYPELSSKLDKTLDYYLFSSLVCWLVSNTLTAFNVFFDSTTIGTLSFTFQLSLLAPLVYCLTRWLMIIAKNQNASFIQFDRLTTDEYASLSYALPILVSSIINLLYTLSSGELSWQNRSERGLLVHAAVIYTVHMTLILVPGRILHMFAVTKMNLLRLKQIFVRHVSHEIRSPLNVVHVGLEMLVSLINSADPTSPFISIDRDTADFIIQMFFSSESAINILNDLLQYEHIEAGTFRLSCEALSLVNVLENKFGWANVMASQKGVAFRVNDTSLATEFGPIASVTMADEESGLDIVPPDESLSAQRSLILYIDIYRIEQVIRNLITNAIKFTPRDGEVSVGISFKTVSPTTITTIKDKFGPDAVGYLRVEIIDSGVGLSEDEQRNVFEEFTQFNKNELQGGGGSGLGLWLSRHIIHMHKGFMSVYSAGRGHGSTFFFELPVFEPSNNPPQPTITQPQPQIQLLLPQQPKPVHHQARPRRLRNSSSVACEDAAPDRRHAWIAEPPDADGTSNISVVELINSAGRDEQEEGPGLELELESIEQCDSARPLRLLIVDDSSLNIKVVVRLIESEKAGPFANATLLTADDGTTAVEQLRTELAAGRAVHFILMDFVMVTMHGPEAARIMREELNYNGPIIGITGNALPEDIDFFMSSGANQVVTKPLSRAKLLDALHHFLPMAMAMAAEEEKKDQ